MTPATRKPHSQPQRATTAAVTMKDMNSPRYGLVEKMLYQVPLEEVGNHLERLMTPGAGPIDWNHPFKPHRIRAMTKRAE